MPRLGGSAAGPTQILWYIVKRVLTLLVVLLLIASVDFVAFRVFSDGLIPRTGNPELNELIVSEYRLNYSKPDQYLWFMLNTMTLDFGHSITYASGQPVADIVYPALERSLWLFGVVGVLAILTGVLYEAFASSMKTKPSRMSMRLIALGFLALPSMGLAELGQDIASRFDLLPVFAAPYNPDLHGGVDWARVIHNIESGFLPVLVCVLVTFGFISLFYRRQAGDGLNVANLRTGVVQVIKTIMSDRWPMKFYLAWIVSCALIIDVFFNYHGLGTYLWNSVYYRDLVLAMATFLFIAAILAVSNCVLDIVAVLMLRNTDSMYSTTDSKTDAPAPQADPVAQPSPALSFASIWNDYRRSRVGLAALVVFIAIIACALTAPWLSTVPDPASPVNYEMGNPPDWLNPLPPSFDPSPYTGYRHPLGTDYRGMDMYSAMLYGSKDALASCVTVAALSFILGLTAGLIGAVLSKGSGFMFRSFGWAANAVGDTFVAIPLMIILIGPLVDPGLDYFAVPAVVALAIFLWASVFVAHRVGLRIKACGGAALRSQDRVGAFIPTILAEALRITKLSVTAGLLSVFMIQFIGFADPTIVTWGGLIEAAFERNVFMDGFWWGYVPPVLGICLLVVSSFVIIDTLERIVRRKENAVEAAATQSSAATTA